MTNIAVVYYSSTGNVHALAEGVATGAEETGAEVRLRRVGELAPADAIDSRPDWRAHLETTAQVPLASLEDLRWADGFAFGTPTRFGNVSAQLKQFLDTAGPLWAEGVLADKPATAFTSAITLHSGNESTLLALYHTMHHWGAISVPPGYTDEAFSEAGGNPYGVCHPSGDGPPGDAALEAARRQGRRLARITARLRTPVGAPA
jgi:NAD(P)H dehydrogenase (quinone)